MVVPGFIQNQSHLLRRDGLVVLHFAGDERVRALCLRCKGIVSPGTADDRDCAEHFADRRAAHRRKPQRFLNVRSKVLRCHFFRQLAHVDNVRFALF